MDERGGDKYAFLQLAHAVATGQRDKAKKWSDVLSGILTGELKVGDRRPVQGMPVWATPEIMRGGFATGAYKAGGSLLGFEQELAHRLGVMSMNVAIVRTAINRWYLTDTGRAELLESVEQALFTVDAPEEAALLAIAIVADRHPDLARAVIEEIAPFFDRLRFYPRPTAQIRGEGLHVSTVDMARENLAKMKPSRNVLLQHYALTLWIPLYDKLIDLLADRGEVTDNRKRADWERRARAWDEAYTAAKRSTGSDQMAKRWADKNGPFQRCRTIMQAYLDSDFVKESDRQYANLHVARHKAKYGNGQERAALRSTQLEQEVDAWHDALSLIILNRLTDLDGDGGIENVEAVLEPISEAEATAHAPVGAALPASANRIIRLAKSGTLDVLIEGRQVGSPETMATLIPQMAARLYRDAFFDAAAGQVYAALYEAFFKRRSVLLLNLQSQVKIEELPWARALLSLAYERQGGDGVSQTMLDELVRMALTHFPYAPFPNPFVGQMQILGRQAGLTVSFVPELASDIFMGLFSGPYEKAAEQSVEFFRNSFYADYYMLPDSFNGPDLAKFCLQRCGPSHRQGWSVAHNGMQIEQAMIITSHNLAAVFSTLSLDGLDYAAAAQKCFQWICTRLEKKPPDWHADLIAIKQSAYAWRNMIAFLSQLDPVARKSCWADIHNMLSERSSGLQQRLAPMMLRPGAVMGQRIPPDANLPIFLGWTEEKHPLRY